MSARSHAAHHDETPIEVPVSAGFPISVRISFLAAIVLAVVILGLVVAVSAANHVWPSGNSLKIPL
jgi:hypothetical protein